MVIVMRNHAGLKQQMQHAVQSQDVLGVLIQAADGAKKLTVGYMILLMVAIIVFVQTPA